jgi:hypothetical protein
VSYGTAAGTATQGNDSRVTGACQTSGCTMTGAFTPQTTTGITASNGTAAGAAGYVGQVVSGTASSIAVTANTVVNLVAITLPAGDWDCWGNVQYSVMTAAANNVQAFLAVGGTAIAGSQNIMVYGSSIIIGGTQMPTGTVTQLISSSETLNLSAFTNTGGTASGWVWCRRGK